MTMKVHANAPWVNIDKPGSPQLTLSQEEQVRLLEALAKAHGMVLVGAEARKPVPAALRVARYLEGRRGMPHLDPEEIHGVWVNREDESRDLLVSDLQALLDYVRGA